VWATSEFQWSRPESSDIDCKTELREASQDVHNSEARRGPIFFEPKSLLQKLLGSKAVASVLGPDAQSLAEKYFEG
jgi:hypothetical protein